MEFSESGKSLRLQFPRRRFRKTLSCRTANPIYYRVSRIVGNLYCLPGTVRPCCFYGRTTHKGNWCKKSSRCRCVRNNRITFKRLSDAGGDRYCDSPAHFMVCVDQVARQFCLPHRSDVVDICSCRYSSHTDRFADRKLPICESCDRQSCQLIKERITLSQKYAAKLFQCSLKESDAEQISVIHKDHQPIGGNDLLCNHITFRVSRIKL